MFYKLIQKNEVKYIILILNCIFIYINYKLNFKKKIEFFYEQKKHDYCNNYGLFVYDYVYSLVKPMKTLNIGDYIQSLAAYQYLPKNCMPILIDRDTIQYYHGPKVKLIMNGWFLIKEGNKFASEQIEPYYISLHINNNIADKRIIEYLKKYEPIGCRDTGTYKLLKKKGINAYFSSCLTTTLDINYYKTKNLRTEEIIFTNFKYGYYSKADLFIKNLKGYNFSNITYLSHGFSTKINHLERFRIADNILKKYAKAKLVITTKIHAALPCLALKTPVILVNKKYDSRRFGGLYNLLNTIGINSKGNFEIKVKLNKKGLVINPNQYLKYSIKLKKLLKDKFK